MAEGKKEYQTGDLISINRGPYHHWALFWKHDNGKDYVAHVSGGTTHGKQIQSEFKVDELQKVVNGSPFSVNEELTHLKPRSPEEIGKVIQNTIGQKISYDPLGNNCQHIASNIRFGQRKSPEGDKGIKVLNQNLDRFGKEMDHFSGFGTEKFN